MATFLQISAFRLQINDPAGALYFEEVATPPQVTFLPQTAYKYSTNERYYMEGFIVNLRVSDTQIESWLDDTDITDAEALVLAYKRIIVSLGGELQVASMSNGTEATEFANLTELLNYYKGLLEDAQNEAGTGKSPRSLTSVQPNIIL